MRKIHLIDMVEDFLSGGDAPADIRKKYHPAIIKKWVENAGNTAIVNLYEQGRMIGDLSILDAWARNYPITLGTGDRAALPYPPMQLPNGMGILQVADGRDSNFNPENVYAYRDTNANAVFAALEIGTVSTKPHWYLEINNSTGINSHVIVIGNKPTATTGITVKMVVPWDQIDDYSTIAIPKENGIDLIISKIIQMLSQKPPMDYINDNKAQQI